MGEFRARIKLEDRIFSNKIKKLVNGKIAILAKWSGNDDDYVLYGFEDGEIDKAFWWEIERNDLFGIYKDKDYDKFSNDYDNGEYETDFSIVIKEDEFERIENE